MQDNQADRSMSNDNCCDAMYDPDELQTMQIFSRIINQGIFMEGH